MSMGKHCRLVRFIRKWFDLPNSNVDIYKSIKNILIVVRVHLNERIQSKLTVQGSLLSVFFEILLHRTYYLKILSTK